MLFMREKGFLNGCTTVPKVIADPRSITYFHDTVIPGEPNDEGRDPESRKMRRNQISLNLRPSAARDDELESSGEGPGRITTFYRVRYK